MFRKNPVKFDVAFVLPHLLHMPTGGDRELAQLCQRLVKDNYKVAVIYLKDPERTLSKTLSDEALKSYVKNRSIVSVIYYKLLSSCLGFHLILPILRRITQVDYRENYRGIRVHFMRNLSQSFSCKKLVAQSWEGAFFVNQHEGSEQKYYRIHHDLADPSFSGALNKVAAMSFELPLKKIVESDSMENRFSSESPIRIHDGIDSERFPCKTDPREREKVVLFPLRTNSSKGAVYAIEAASRIRNVIPDIRIIAFGNYPRKSIPDFIEFHGIVRFEKLISMYNEAAVTIIPSIVEGTSLPALEAMSCGSALISTENGGVNSFVKNGINAMLVPVRDPEAIAKAVIGLLNDFDKRVEIALNGIQSARLNSHERTYEEFVKGIGLVSTG